MMSCDMLQLKQLYARMSLTRGVAWLSVTRSRRKKHHGSRLSLPRDCESLEKKSEWYPDDESVTWAYAVTLQSSRIFTKLQYYSINTNLLTKKGQMGSSYRRRHTALAGTYEHPKRWIKGWI